jgi:hypothetical protein
VTAPGPLLNQLNATCSGSQHCALLPHAVDLILPGMDDSERTTALIAWTRMQRALAAGGAHVGDHRRDAAPAWNCPSAAPTAPAGCAAAQPQDDVIRSHMVSGSARIPP